MECHNNTYTDTLDSAKELMNAVGGHENVWYATNTIKNNLGLVSILRGIKKIV